MAYWLFKSEPGNWSWDKQCARGKKGECWLMTRPNKCEHGTCCPRRQSEETQPSRNKGVNIKIDNHTKCVQVYTFINAHQNT